MTFALRPEDPRLIGGYRIEARLGTGGMGVVYLGVAPDGRRVAVKLVRAEFRDDAAFRSRFRREVEAAARVRGRYVAALVAAAPDDVDPWLATEYVPGRTLAAAVQELGPLPEREVRGIIAGLVEAVRAIHAAGLVHRDLKPANVILGPDGPRVIDLGVAHVGDATALTGTGLQLGTPMFMAPEQAEGSATTPAVDVWAVGAVACFAASGAGPFGAGKPTALLYRVVHDQPQLDRVPPGLHGLVAACLAKDPAARPTLDQLAAALAPPAAGLDLPYATTPTLPDDDAATSIRAFDLPASEGVPGMALGMGTGTGQDAIPVGTPHSVPAAAEERPPARRRALLVAGVAAGLVLTGGIVTAVVTQLPGVGEGPDVVAGPSSPAPAESSRAASGGPRDGKKASPGASAKPSPSATAAAAGAGAGAGATPASNPNSAAPSAKSSPEATSAGGDTTTSEPTRAKEPTAEAPATNAPAEPAGPKAWTKGALGIEVLNGAGATTGSTLHITSSGWDPALVTENTNCSWRWEDERTVRSGTSSSCSYTLTAADKGHRLILYITTHQEGYTSATAKSAPSAVVR